MKLFISAGETSGDIHGAFLVSEIKKLSPNTTFVGLGSDRMKAVGVDVRCDISTRGTIGIMEALPNIIYIYSIFIKTKELLLKEKPDAIILIDSQGFNVPLAEYAKKIGIKTIYYIAPQEWLWGKKEKTAKLAKTLGMIIAIFPKEFEAYKEAGANVEHFGHPLLDIVKPTMAKELARKEFGCEGRGKIVTLCGGSRKQELKNVFPIILDSAKIIRKSIPNAFFLIPAPTENIHKYLNSRQEIKTLGEENYKIIFGQTYDALNISDAAICVSGTINLEASILGVPNIMVYKLNPLTYWIGKNILKIGKKLKFFSMPNILLNRKLIAEFIQEDANPEELAKEAIRILNQQKTLDNGDLLNILGKKPVISKIADKILTFISN